MENTRDPYSYPWAVTSRPIDWARSISPIPVSCWHRTPDHVRAPDAAFVSTNRLKQIGESSGFALGAPDLAIEVISPNDRYTEVDEKVADWLDAGTLAVVVVNPRRRTVNVHHSHTDVSVLTESDTLDVDVVVPGWRMPVKDIFE